MNSINLIGRVTKDIEIFEGKIKIGKITIAVPRPYKNEDGEYESDFFNCVVFNASDYFKNNILKGTLVGVEGRIQNRDYIDKDGNKRFITEIIANRVQILNKVQNVSQKPQNDAKNPFEEFNEDITKREQMEIDTTDLPF